MSAPAPQTFGIVNITADSFSDGGRYLSPETAIVHARKLIADGVDVLDLGAAASNPDAAHVPPADEIARLAPVVAALSQDRTPISIDSFATETLRWALSQNVAWLNDILGFPDASLYPELLDSEAQLVVMHSVVARGKAERIDTDPEKIFTRLFDFFDMRIGALMSAGIAPPRIVLDPGMGFFLGTNPEVSLEVLRRLPELKARYGLRVLVSVSRKSFIRNLAGVGVAESGPATAAAEIFAAEQGADFIRTHDVSALKQALKVWIALAHRPK